MKENPNITAEEINELLPPDIRVVEKDSNGNFVIEDTREKKTLPKTNDLSVALYGLALSLSVCCLTNKKRRYKRY